MTLFPVQQKEIKIQAVATVSINLQAPPAVEVESLEAWNQSASVVSFFVSHS